MLTKFLMFSLEVEVGSQATRPRPSSEYEFVAWTDTSGNTNAAARKLVRSHTMRLYQLRQGQSKSPSEIQHHSKLATEPKCAAQKEPKSLTNEFKEFLATMPQEVLTLDPFDCLPVRMQPYMLDLFAKCKPFVYHFLRERSQLNKNFL
jgi:hypothetical protein